MNRAEAIKIFKSWIADYKVEEAAGGLKLWQKQRMELFIEALEGLEKQTTKYKHLGTRHTHWGKCRHDKFRCETCGFTIEFTDNHTAQYKYCPSCGRKINWSKPKGDSYDFAIIDEVIAYDTQKED